MVSVSKLVITRFRILHQPLNSRESTLYKYIYIWVNMIKEAGENTSMILLNQKSLDLVFYRTSH